MITLEIRVREAFLAALMLTGTIEAAEKAVLESIATSGPGVAVDELLVGTAKCAVQLRDDCLPPAETPPGLPPELQRLFLLSPVGRDCFVLRMLMGLTLEVSSEILNLHSDEVDEALCRTLSDLRSLDSVQPKGSDAKIRSVEIHASSIVTLDRVEKAQREDDAAGPG